MLLALNKYRRGNRNTAMLQYSLEDGEKRSSSNGCFDANEIFLTRLITIKIPIDKKATLPILYIIVCLQVLGVLLYM